MSLSGLKLLSLVNQNSRVSALLTQYLRDFFGGFMRFFKYLVFLFLSSLSISSFAATVYYITDTSLGFNKDKTFSSPSSACSSYASAYNAANSSYKLAKKGFDTSDCIFIFKTAEGTVINSAHRVTLSSMNQCPANGWPVPVYLPKGTTRIPIRMCKDGCTIEGSGKSIETNNYTMTTMQFTGDSVNCTQAYKDDPVKCDTKDPYGDCYVPPNDDCVRLKDGSIQCPDNQSPPPNNTCNGADYCKRPPQGCGPGYVPGSFNGEQLCVRSGPNTPKNPPDPDKPDDPNNCMNGGTYCPQPPDNTKCPSGYSETTFNGSKICVKDNPDPEKPNPNDPNNPDYGGGGDNGSGGSEPTDGGDNGSGSSINLNPVIDAIKSLRDSLLSAIDGVSKKLSTLVDGQKESNEHLKNIKSESVKTNEKLDTSNGHLDKIEEATQATSTAVGETNKKLDQIFSDQGKEQIQQLGEQSTDSRLTAAESEMTSKLQTFANTLSYSSSHACISDFIVTDIPHFGSMTVPLSKWCDLLALVKLLLKLAVLMLALKMIDATVRAF
ncbi:MAG: hypothetical protein ACK4KY_14920 [Acinetobacter junii]